MNKKSKELKKLKKKKKKLKKKKKKFKKKITKPAYLLYVKSRNLRIYFGV